MQPTQKIMSQESLKGTSDGKQTFDVIGLNVVVIELLHLRHFRLLIPKNDLHGVMD
jgi:hypothetical protein